MQICVCWKLPGEQILFEATNVGDKRLLNKGLIASEKLVLKVGAKVMFINNINDRIKNGVQGTMTSFLNGLPVVATESESLLVVVVNLKSHKSQWVMNGAILQM